MQNHGPLKTRIILSFAIGVLCLILIDQDFPFDNMSVSSLITDGGLLCVAVIALVDFIRSLARLVSGSSHSRRNLYD